MDYRNRPVPELVQQAQIGSLPAFDALVRRFQRMAIGYAGYLLGDAAHCEDAAQEAFLEAFRTLPALREGAAFPGWLRLLVKKHCDRFRRGHRATLPLDSLTERAAPDSPEREALRREEQAHVRRLVRGLPAREREAVTLYYLGERSCAEIASFLSVPVSTVKNRLATARKRLRERIVPDMDETMTDETTPRRPQETPADSGFRERLFGRLYQEYSEQVKRDPIAADRSLLARARENLRDVLRETTGPVDWETAWHGHHVFWKLGELREAIALLERYLMQPLVPSEEVWARRRRLFLLAQLFDFDSCKIVAAEHPAFVAWVREQAAKSVISLPSYGFDRMPDDCLPIWAVGGMDVANNYVGADAFPVYEELALAALADAPKFNETREERFSVLFALLSQRALIGRKADALGLVPAIRALADEEPGHWLNPLWPIEAESSVIYIENRADRDISVIRAAAERLAARINDWEAQLPPGALTEKILRQPTLALDDRARERIADQRHNLAFLLMGTDQYDLAIPLFEEAIAGAIHSPYTYLWCAASVWAQTEDRERTLSLLQQGAQLAAVWRIGDDGKKPSDEFRADFQRQRQFADVKDDRAFLAAVDVG